VSDHKKLIKEQIGIPNVLQKGCAILHRLELAMNDLPERA